MKPILTSLLLLPALAFSQNVGGTSILARFSGAGAPGSISGSKPADFYTNTTNADVYVCNHATGPCTAVAAANWVAVTGSAGSGTVTDVGWTGGLVSVATSTTTPAFTVAGTSGGIPYFSSASAWASSAALTANLPVIGGGAGVAPTVGTRSGNTTAFVTTTGTQTSGRCVEIDANGNHIQSAAGCASGSGTVTVVGAGALTSTAIVTGGGTTTLQTPSATSTLSSAGNMVLAGSLTATTGMSSGGATNACDGTGGCMQLGQGTAPTAQGTTAIQDIAPAAVTSYRIVRAGAAATGFFYGSNASNVVTQTFRTIVAGDLPSASTTASGIAELAIDTEVTTGSSATLAVTPDALAGSTIFGVKTVEVELFPAGTAAATGDGKAYFRIPAGLNGMNLVSIKANVYTAGTTGTINIDIARCVAAATGNVCSSTVADVLSTNLTIDSAENDSGTAAAAAVIDTANDDVATGQLYRFDIDAIHTTPSQGLILELTFQLP